MKSFVALLSVSLSLAHSFAAGPDLAKLPPAATRAIDFAKDIQPIFEQGCLKCHSGEKAKGNFLLDTREHALKGGENGQDLLPGDGAHSPLVQFTARLVEDSEMPPNGKGKPLSNEQIGLLRAWIDQGAKWPEHLTLKTTQPGSASTDAAVAANLPPAADHPVDFVRDIQPIFASHCLECHGPAKQEAQFRLDAKEIALKGGELGPAINPGKSAESLLILAVAGAKPDLVMPKKGEHLTPEQVGLLRGWIDQGAIWPESASVKVEDKRDHWAFKAPVRPPVPTVTRKGWVRNPIDAFILARLEKEKLSPSPPATPVTLIRRLSLDLTGLPPTIKEVESFAADRSTNAYERAVERLLASPHYGEHWARHWLDLARYADTNGYEKDKPRSIWPYRDWVIKAFNEDLPFDKFTIDQLAGDLEPSPTLDQRIATGFLRNSMLNQEGGVEPEQFRVEALIDRMDTVGKAFLGLTINCCQCHNHKFDPFSQKEYYQLYAFLNNDDESFIEVPSAADKKKRKAILASVRDLEAKAMRESTNLTERMASWEKRIAQPATNWTVLNPKDWGNFATKFEKEEDGSLLGGGDLQPGGTMRVTADTRLTNITAFRLDALTNANLKYGGPGLVGKGGFMVKEFVAEVYAITNATVTNKIKFTRAVADLEAPSFSVTNAIDGNTEKGGWVPSLTPDHRNQNHYAIFEAEKPFGFPEGTRIEITIDQKFDKETGLDCHMLGCLRLSITTNSGPLEADPLTGGQRNLLSIAKDKRTDAQNASLFAAFRLSDPDSKKVNEQITEAFAKWPYPPTTLVLHDRSPKRVTHIFKRGDRLRPGDEVHPAVLSVLNSLPPGAPANRLGFAQWIVDRKSPTTARVLVNRLWQTYFGQGLVTTPEDFGTRVETPSHPELLDWLACEFMDSGWSIKHMQRLIAESATFRQSSKVTPDEYAKDQFNHFLERGPRFRVEGEVVQDIALSASGLLNPKIGGPSIYPPIPASVGDTAYGGFSWPETKGPERYRRGLYTFTKRSLPFPSLSAFDVPSGEISCPRRIRSNTPLQALTTLNEKAFVEAAQAMALRVYREGGKDDRARATYAFELCTSRKPDDFELKKLLNFWHEEYSHFETSTASALKVAVPDLANIPEGVNLHKVAAWAMVSRTILNLDETVTKE
jgi:mono/diheme cytochrome c family protein